MCSLLRLWLMVHDVYGLTQNELIRQEVVQTVSTLTCHLDIDLISVSSSPAIWSLYSQILHPQLSFLISRPNMHIARARRQLFIPFSVWVPPLFCCLWLHNYISHSWGEGWHGCRDHSVTPAYDPSMSVWLYRRPELEMLKVTPFCFQRQCWEANFCFMGKMLFQ